MPIATSTAALIAAGIGAGGSVAGSMLGGGTKNKLTNLPPPGKMYPGMDEMFQGFLKQYGPQAAGSMANASSPTKMNFNPNVDIGNLTALMQSAKQRQLGQQKGDLLETFGGAGLRQSSPAAQAMVDLQTQSSKDYLGMMSQLNYQNLSMNKDREMQAMFKQADLDDAAKGRELATNFNWVDMVKQMAMTLYPTAAIGSAPGPLDYGLQGGMLGLSLLDLFTKK